MKSEALVNQKKNKFFDNILHCWWKKGHLKVLQELFLN